MLSDEAPAARTAALGAAADMMEAVTHDVSGALAASHPVAAALSGVTRDKTAAVRVALAEALPLSRAHQAPARGSRLHPLADVDMDASRGRAAIMRAVRRPWFAFVGTLPLPTMDVLIRDESVGGGPIWRRCSCSSAGRSTAQGDGEAAAARPSPH